MPGEGRRRYGTRATRHYSALFHLAAVAGRRLCRLAVPPCHADRANNGRKGIHPSSVDVCRSRRAAAGRHFSGDQRRRDPADDRRIRCARSHCPVGRQLCRDSAQGVTVRTACAQLSGAHPLDGDHLRRRPALGSISCVVRALRANGGALVPPAVRHDDTARRSGK